MKLKNIIDAVQRNAEGAVTNTGSRFSPKALKKMINSYRAAIIEKNYRTNDMINPICYQRFYLYYSKDLQTYAPENAVLFECPRVIQLGEEDGIRYIGSKDCNRAWTRVFNRGLLASMNSHPMTSVKNNPNIIYCLLEDNLEVYNGENLREGMIEGIFANPLDIPTFNEEQDDYPMSEDDIAEMETMIYAQRTAIAKITDPENNFNIPDYKEAQPPRNERL